MNDLIRETIRGSQRPGSDYGSDAALLGDNQVFYLVVHEALTI